jgi:uncharacterized protein with HEPN domain
MSKTDKIRVRGYLEHILKAIQRIRQYVENIDEAGFLEDLRTQDAVIRNIEIIGEACKNIEQHHPDFAAEHSEVPWGVAYEMRNALAHGYFKVDLEIVWQTTHQDLPPLATLIENLLKVAK